MCMHLTVSVVSLVDGVVGAVGGRIPTVLVPLNLCRSMLYERCVQNIVNGS